ncbi:MAG: PD-(D/E)XK nuclease family protein [Planctomycetota bacterium]
MASRAAVSFIIGRAGSGKTHWCFDRITELLRADPLGPPVWLVTLRQATLETSRAFMLHSRLPAVSRLRVVSFDRMSDEILAECGGNALPQLTATGRRLLVSHILRTQVHELTFFAPVATRPGTAEEICGLLDELDRAGQTVDDLAEIVWTSDEPALADPRTRNKTNDLVTIGRAYKAALAGRIEPRVRQQAVLDALPTCTLVDRCHVFVDGFWDFDLPDRRLLAGLADRATAIHVTATIDPTTPKQPPIFERTGTSFDQVRRTLDPDTKADVIRLTTQRRWDGPRRNLAQLAERWANGDGPPTGHRGIRFIEAPDVRSEVRAVAGEIRVALDSGLRQRDCMVLVRDMESYATPLREVFDEFGLVLFADERRPARHMPLVRMVRALLRVAAEGYPHDAVVGMIGTGLAGMSIDDAERLERFVSLHRLRGTSAWTDPAPWSFRRRPHRNDDETPNELLPDESPRMDALRRRLVADIAPLRILLERSSFHIEDAVATLFRTATELGVATTLATQIDACRAAGDEEHAAEIEQVWQSFTDMLDQFHALLGNDETTPDDFVADMFAALDDLDLAIAPPTVDAVLVGEVERVRTGDKPFVAVLGLSDGIFPAVPSEPVLLGDAQRRALTRHDLQLQRDSERRLLDERFLMHHALTRASDQLLLTRPVRSRTAPLAPSVFWSELQAGIANAETQPGAYHSLTINDLAAQVTSWAHGEHDDQRMGDLYAALRAERATNHTIIDAAWRALRYENVPELPVGLAESMFGKTFTGSISRLESRGRCGFKHFAEYGLQLAEEESDQLTVQDVGTLFHAAAERVVGELIERDFDFGGSEPDGLDGMIGAAIEELTGKLRGRIWMSPGRSRYERERLQAELGRTVRHQLAFLRHGDFAPTAVEVRFGEDAEWPAPSGDGWQLRGRIDRIDRTPDGFASIIDYKTSAKMFRAADLDDGVGVQLPAYLLAASAAGFRPAGAFFVPLRQALKSVKHPSDIEERPTGPKPRGVFDAELIRRFDRDADNKSTVLQYERTQSGKIAARSPDPLDGDSLGKLLMIANRRISALAARATSGDIRARPWRRGTQSACAHCTLKSVCRHEPRRNGYEYSDNRTLADLLAEVDDG